MDSPSSNHRPSEPPERPTSRDFPADPTGYRRGRSRGAPPGSRRSRLLLGLRWLMATGPILLANCSAGHARAPSADQQKLSEAEYDLASDLWLRQNNPREALQHALRAVDLDRRNADAAHLVALLYLDFCSRPNEECRLEAAEAEARRALELDEDFRAARNTLGVILIHRSRYAQAVEVLRPLTADMVYSTPENAWGNLGWAYLELGQTDKAIDALERSIAAQPMFCVGNYRLGLAYEKKGDPTRAVEALTRAVQTEDPACQALQTAYLARGRVLARMGDTEAARQDLEHCVELAANNPEGEECGSMLQGLK